MLKKLSKKKIHTRYKLKDGRLVPGASTIARYDAPSPHLMRWAYNCGVRKENFDEVRNLAAEIGTSTHFLIEGKLNGFECDLSDYSQNVIDAAQTCLENFWRVWEENEMTLLGSEIKLVSEEYEYGGTLDLLCLNRRNEKTLWDYKVTSGVYFGHRAQLSGYQALHDENFPDDPILTRALVRIPKDKDQNAEVHHQSNRDMELHFEAFKAQLKLYYALKAIK